MSLNRLENVANFTEFVKAFSHFGMEMVELAHLTSDRKNVCFVYYIFFQIILCTLKFYMAQFKFKFFLRINQLTIQYYYFFSFFFLNRI